jgi:hypothetical protein
VIGAGGPSGVPAIFNPNTTVDLDLPPGDKIFQHRILNDGINIEFRFVRALYPDTRF